MAETQYILTSTKTGKQEYVALPTGNVAPHNQAWSTITDTPSSLSGYGIEDAVNSAVSAAIALIVDSSPSTLDTLNELAAALGDDPNFATTVTNLIGTKAPIANPSLTGDILLTANDPVITLHTNSAGTILAPRNRKYRWTNYADEEAGSINLLDYNQESSQTDMDFSVRNGLTGVVSKVMRLSPSGANVTGEVKGTSFKTANFEIIQDGSELHIKYGTTVIATISSAGYIKAANEIEPHAAV